MSEQAYAYKTSCVMRSNVYLYATTACKRISLQQAAWWRRCLPYGIALLVVGAFLYPIMRKLPVWMICLMFGTCILAFFVQARSKKPDASDRRMAKVNEKNALAPDQQIVLTFYDAYFSSETALVRAEIQYSAITALVETPDYYFLFAKNTYNPVDKTKFLAGDAETFPAFITDRCKRPMQRMEIR